MKQKKKIEIFSTLRKYTNDSLELIKLNKGITLVSLVVTIIILIILASVSINLVLGEEGIFTIAKKAKENMELAQIEEQEKLNALYTELEFNTEGEGGNDSSSYDAILKLLEFKKAIADAIVAAGGIPLEDPTADAVTFADKIKKIVEEVTKDANATEADLLLGKTAWVKGKKITGTMPNNNAVNQTLNAEESYTIPAGYHNGSGKVTANSLESQTPGNATAADIAKDKIAWVNGNKIIGNATEKIEIKLVTSNSKVNIPKGVKTAYILQGGITNYNYENISISGDIVESYHQVARVSCMDNSSSRSGGGILYELSFKGVAGTISVSFSRDNRTNISYTDYVLILPSNY